MDDAEGFVLAAAGVKLSKRNPASPDERTDSGAKRANREREELPPRPEAPLPYGRLGAGFSKIQIRRNPTASHRASPAGGGAA
jgi:hypothetical protein